MTHYLSLPIRRKSTWIDDSSAASSTNIAVQSRRLSQHSNSESGNLSNFQINLASHLRQFDHSNDEIVKINVGGQLFQTYRSTLSNVPKTRLAELNENSPFYVEETKSYFFDRNPFIFQFILDFYRDGEMHIPRDVCARQIQKDLCFWEIKISSLANCCKKYYEDIFSEIETYESLCDEFKGVSRNVYSVHSKTYDKYDRNSCRIRIWEFLDDYSSSKFAKVWHMAYMILIMISILTYFTSTMESCKVSYRNSIYFSGRHYNGTNSSHVREHPVPKIQRILNTVSHPVLQVIELSCLIFFTIEFIFRFCICPWKLRLLKNITTYVDLMYIIPSWTLILIETSHGYFWHTQSGITVYVALEAVEVLRVLRIIRFVKHYRGLRMLYLAIKHSLSELSLLLVFVCFHMTIMASFIYCAEIFSPDYFENAFHGMWWALITMTTVGYGDMYPVSWVGYLVGSVCAVTGIIMIQMPVPIIVSNFHAYYGLRISDDDDEDENIGSQESVRTENSEANHSTEETSKNDTAEGSKCKLHVHPSNKIDIQIEQSSNTNICEETVA